MTRAGSTLVVVALVALVGCATRSDLIRRDRRVQSVLRDQTRQLAAMQRELERLRAQIEGTPDRAGRGPGVAEHRLVELEDRITRLEGGAPIVPGGEPMPEQDALPGSTASAPVVGAETSPPPEEEGWRRGVAREQAEAGTINVPERADYLAILDGLARRDCSESIPKLNGFAIEHAESPLTDDALYWVGRCYEVEGDQNQAVSKFYDVVTRFPQGSKAAAALWAQGNLFVEMGDTPDARLAFSKLIRDYPTSDEAVQARRKLSQLEY